MRKPILFLLFIALGLPTALMAQDQHFTQFFASPLTLNPALSGTFNGKYRVALIHRDQDPFQTFSGAIDLRFDLNRVGKSNKDAFGVGVVFYNDRVPAVGFSNNNINVAGAFHKSLSRAGDQYLSAGFQVGLAQRNFNYESFNFDDQFAGDGSYTNPTAEILPENNFAHADLGVGINYTYAPERGLSIFAGAAMHHILEPQISFYYEEEESEFSNSSLLHRKYTAYVNFSIPIGEAVSLQPRGLFYAQGPHLALNAGANFRFLFDEISGTALHVGGWARPVSNEDNSFSMDAVVGMVGVEYSNFLLGFSYDAQLESLGAVRDRRGAFELSVAYLGEYENETILCPKF